MSQQQTGKTYLQKLQTFAYICLGFPLLFFIYVYLESSVDQLIPLVNPDYNLIIFIPSFILALLLILYGRKQYSSLKNEAIDKPSLKQKLLHYQKANNVRFLFYGMSTLLITIGFFLTNYQAFAALFGIMLVLFSINNPNQKKIITELKLKGDEREVIITGSEIT